MSEDSISFFLSVKPRTQTEEIRKTMYTCRVFFLYSKIKIDTVNNNNLLANKIDLFDEKKKVSLYLNIQIL